MGRAKAFVDGIRFRANHLFRPVQSKIGTTRCFELKVRHGGDNANDTEEYPGQAKGSDGHRLDRRISDSGACAFGGPVKQTGRGRATTARRASSYGRAKGRAALQRMDWHNGRRSECGN